MKCRHCEHENPGTYCAQCGEKFDVPQISLKNLTEHLISSLTSANKGLLYNFLKLSTQPKAFIEGYLNGKRKGIFNPFSYLLLSITIFLILDHWALDARASAFEKESTSSLAYHAGKFLGEYIKYFWVGGAIFLGLASSIFFSAYNLAEHFTIGAFVLGHATFFSLVALLLFDWWLIISNPLVYLVIFLMLYAIYRKKHVDLSTILKVWISLLIFFLQFLVLAFIVAAIFS